MSHEFEEIQKLIRLKRYENPRKGYHDQFLIEFQSRQRAELLNRSAHSIFFERIATYFSGLGNARWVYAAGASYAAVMLGLFSWPRSSPETIAEKELPGGGDALWGGDIRLVPTQFNADVRLLDGTSEWNVPNVIDPPEPLRRRVVMPQPTVRSEGSLIVPTSSEAIIRDF